MCSQNELDVLLKEIAAIYRKVFGDDIVKIVLYGSYARGTFDAESDIDIVAIVKGEREELQRKLREVWILSSNLELEYETILSPTVIPYEEFEKYRNVLPYYRNIEEEGIDIVE
ncbi:MAG: nucleotidyltransferase domain-containing protein [Firmicutes bacterium]|nr:nucleotidyltransferase domain-containing protein [Bacillota bacterium]MDD7601706.1 nucleotidyltransferase domain-containing protein [Bacillota bacterium]MDY5857575.1 nucleotidyltransferase domain-containing protein [Anaerovoracaceae bacterium]